VTSGTVVPYWRWPDSGAPPVETGRRAVALAYLDGACCEPGTRVRVDKGRGRPLPALVVRAHLRARGQHLQAVLYPGGVPAT